MANNHESADDLPTNTDFKQNLRHTFENGQLTCSDCDITMIPNKLIESYGNITSRLDISFNRLESLQGLEHFKFLKELVLDSNALDDSAVFPVLKELHTLTLNKNKLTDLTHLLDQLQACFPNLTYLSLLGNEACPNQLSSSEKDDEDYQRYRYYVLYRLSKLKFLDSSNVTASEVAEAKRIGPYQQIIRPSSGFESSESSTSSSPVNQYSPLPAESQEAAEIDRHEEEIRDTISKRTFGRSKYVYYGKHSEGNRFIRNRDL